MKIRNPFRHEPADPAKPHWFVATVDEGMSQAASGGAFRSGSQVNQVAVMNLSVPSDRCLLAGCSRDREDPIHWAAED